MSKSNLTIEQINRMDFSSIVGVTDEPNTPSGGGDTIRRILTQIPFSKNRRVLDVGCNTGFASIEFAGWTDAEVTGVDINPISLEYAKSKGHTLSNLKFLEINALQLPFADESFDLVYVNNVTSFISDKKTAISEYYRVLAAGGVLAVVPIFYHSAPPESVHKEVEAAVGTKIPIRGKDFWYDLFQSENAALFFDEDYEYVHQSQERIDWYVEFVMDQPSMTKFSRELRDALGARLKYFYELFNENLR